MKKSILLLSLMCIMSAVTVYAQNLVSEDRNIGEYTAISATNGIDVYLLNEPGNMGTVKIESNKEQWLGKILTEVKQGTLYISFDGKRPHGENLRLRVYVPVKELTAIKASGGSDIESKGLLALKDLAIDASGGSDIDLNLTAESITVKTRDGSDVDLEGVAVTLNCEASGGSDLNAKKLKTKHVVLNVSGGSDAEVYASESITGRASGGSDVDYFGNPSKIEISSDRSSDVHKR